MQEKNVWILFIINKEEEEEEAKIKTKALPVGLLAVFLAWIIV